MSLYYSCVQSESKSYATNSVPEIDLFRPYWSLRGHDYHGPINVRVIQSLTAAIRRAIRRLRWCEDSFLLGLDCMFDLFYILFEISQKYTIISIESSC